MTGETIGKYTIVERIGRGGVGTVYRARDRQLGHDVAIKVLNTATVDSVQIRRFEKEALALARLAHPGIAAMLDLVEHQDERLMVMELVRGETLDHLVRRQGPLPPVRAAALLVQALSALADAHREGVIHRDLKPANLMLTEAGPLKILDFGVALVVGTDPLTDAGLLVGTPAYMAPEQVTGAPVDARTDVYSMGLVFYFLVTGKLPFAGKTPALMAQARVDVDPAPAVTHIRGLPSWVDRILAKALAREPTRRFQSAAEFREALEAGIRESPVTGSGIVIAPEAETVAMPVPSFARRAGTTVQAGAEPSGPPSLGAAPASASRPAPNAPPRPPRRPVSAGTMRVAALILAALIVLLLWFR